MVGWVGGDFVGCYWLYYYLSLEKMYLVEQKEGYEYLY